MLDHDIAQCRTETDVLDALFRSEASKGLYAVGAALAHQGEPSDFVFRILRGCVRSCAYSEQGDRRILEFLGPGDFFGLGDAAHWSTSQEAVDTVVVEILPRRLFESRLKTTPALQGAVRHHLVARIEAYSDLLVLTAQSTAVERVRAFLEWFAARRKGSDFVNLPMSRRDIADYLGLSMETVSRAFSTLREANEISQRGACFFRLHDKASNQGEMTYAA